MRILKLILVTGFASILGLSLAQAQSGTSDPQIVTIKQDSVIQNVASAVDTDAHYSSNLKLREERKLGLGTQLGGGLGMAGLDLEINIDGINSVIAGVGTGNGYGTFQVLWRRSFEGQYLSPYVTAGWSRWYNSSNATEYKNSLILDRALNTTEKETGRFGVDFLTASAGVQYHQLSGDLSGLSFFAEFALLAAFSNPSIIPTGTLGSIYYF